MKIINIHFIYIRYYLLMSLNKENLLNSLNKVENNNNKDNLNLDEDISQIKSKCINNVYSTVKESQKNQIHNSLAFPDLKENEQEIDSIMNVLSINPNYFDKNTKSQVETPFLVNNIHNYNYSHPIPINISNNSYFKVPKRQANFINNINNNSNFAYTNFYPTNNYIYNNDFRFDQGLEFPNPTFVNNTGSMQYNNTCKNNSTLINPNINNIKNFNSCMYKNIDVKSNLIYMDPRFINPGLKVPYYPPNNAFAQNNKTFNISNSITKADLILNTLSLFDNNDFEKQVSFISSLNKFEFLEFSKSNNGTKFIINKYSEIYSNIKNRYMLFNMCTVLSAAIFKKAIQLILHYFIDNNASMVLIKILKYLSITDRLCIWQELNKTDICNLAANPCSSNVLINLINTITDKQEEDYITSIIESNVSTQDNKIHPVSKNNINKVLWILATYNESTVTLLKCILSTFCKSSLKPYLSFIFNNLISLSCDRIGYLLIYKYIVILKYDSKVTKNKIYNIVIDNLAKLIMKETGINIIIQIIEEWSYNYVKRIIKESYNNKNISYYKDFTVKIGINRVFIRLMRHSDKVRLVFKYHTSFIIYTCFMLI